MHVSACVYNLEQRLPSAASFLRFTRLLLYFVLSKDSFSQVSLLSHAEVQAYRTMIKEKYGMLNDVCRVADGLKLYLEQSGDTVIQNMFFNGWKHEHYVSKVFVFAPSELIIGSVINAPGAMHDSPICDCEDCMTEWRKFISLRVAKLL